MRVSVDGTSDVAGGMPRVDSQSLRFSRSLAVVREAVDGGPDVTDGVSGVDGDTSAVGLGRPLAVVGVPEHSAANVAHSVGVVGHSVSLSRPLAVARITEDGGTSEAGGQTGVDSHSGAVRFSRPLAVHVRSAAVAGGGEPVPSVPGPLVLPVEGVGVRRGLRGSVGGCEAKGQAACENLQAGIRVLVKFN